MTTERHCKLLLKYYYMLKLIAFDFTSNFQITLRLASGMRQLVSV